MGTEKAALGWPAIRSKIKAKWGKLGDAELECFKDNLGLITERIEKAYGYTKDKAELEYQDFKKTL